MLRSARDYDVCRPMATPRWLFVAVLLTLGCAGDAQLVIDLRTDYVPEREAASARIELVRSGDVGTTQPTTTPLSASVDYVLGARLMEIGPLFPDVYQLSLDVLAPRGEVLASRSIPLELHGGTQVVTVVVTRSAASFCARDDECVPSTSCVEASCDTGECFLVPRDERCDEAQVCDADDGCVDAPPP